MLLFSGLVFATLWVVLGYFILFSSTKTQGGVGTFGKILAVWVFVLAAGFAVAGAYATLTGFSPMESMHSAPSAR